MGTLTGRTPTVSLHFGIHGISIWVALAVVGAIFGLLYLWLRRHS